MKPTTSISNIQVYGAHALYKTPPSEAQADAGVVPLDTLPAAWWNQLWYDITSRNNSMVETVLNIRDEILSVLSDANITPSALQTNQLLQAIEVICRRFPTFDAISHDPIPGSVISSAARNSVSVDSATGQMTPNALSDWASNKSVKTVIGEVDQKVDDISTTVTEAIAAETDAREAKDVADVDNDTTSNTLITTITSSDGTIHRSDEQDIVRSVNVDATTDENTIKVSVNGVEDSDTVVKNVRVDATTDENTIKVSVNGVEDSDTVVKNVSVDRTGDTVTISVNGVEDTFSVAVAMQDYKETEQDTGKKWVNSDKVYSKTVLGKNKQITHDFIVSFLPDNRSNENQASIAARRCARRVERLGNCLYTLGTTFPSVNCINLLYSEDNGETWTHRDVPITSDVNPSYNNFQSYNIIAFNQKLYVVGRSDYNDSQYLLSCTDPRTRTFNSVTNIAYVASAWDCLYVFDNHLFIGSGDISPSNQLIYCMDTDETIVSYNYNDYVSYYNVYVCFFAHVGTRLFAFVNTSATSNLLLYHDAGEAGNVWHLASEEGSAASFAYPLSRAQFASFKGTLYLHAMYYATAGGLFGYKSTDNGRSWTYFAFPITVKNYGNERTYHVLYATETALYMATMNTLIETFPYFHIWYTRDNTNWGELLTLPMRAICLGFMKLADILYAFVAPYERIIGDLQHNYYSTVRVYAIDENAGTATLYDTISLPSLQIADGNAPDSSLSEVSNFPNSAYDEQLTEYRLFMLTNSQPNHYETNISGTTGYHAIYQPIFRMRRHIPNNHINTLPDFKRLVKCDRVVDDKPSEIVVSIDPATGNVDVGDPVRDYEHLDGVQLLLEYTKNEV